MANRTAFFFAFLFILTQAFSQTSANFDMPLSDSIHAEKQLNAPGFANNKSHSGLFKNFHGFFGTSWSYTIPTGDFQDIVEYGTQMRFMDFGLFFTKNIGISGMWHSSSNYDRPHLNKIFYGDGILAGPVLSLPLHDRFTVSARALAGYAKNHHISGHNWRKTSNSSAYMVSFLFSYEIVNDIGLVVDAAYYNSNSKHYIQEGTLNTNRTETTIEIKNYSIGLGISYLIPQLF